MCVRQIEILQEYLMYYDGDDAHMVHSSMHSAEEEICVDVR